MTSDRDRRRERRRTTIDEHGVVSARIVPGCDAALVDVSSAGALVDTQLRLRPGSTIEVRLSTRHQRVVVRGQVVRCAVRQLQPVVYRGAVQFENRLPIFDVAECGQQLPAREAATHGVI